MLEYLKSSPEQLTLALATGWTSINPDGLESLPTLDVKMKLASFKGISPVIEVVCTILTQIELPENLKMDDLSKLVSENLPSIIENLKYKYEYLLKTEINAENNIVDDLEKQHNNDFKEKPKEEIIEKKEITFKEQEKPNEKDK